MTRARKELVADWCRSARRPPIGVYGPTMKTSSRPMTSGGSSRLHSTPVSHTRGNGSFPRASIQARGVQTRNSTPRVTSPDSTEISSGSNAPLAVRELTMALQDRWASKAITGPSKASQIMPAPTTETRVDAERSRSDPPVIRPDPAGRRGPEESSPWTAPPAAAAGLADPVPVGGIRVNPPALYWARPADDSVYLTNAVAAGVGLPMMVMSITCGDPDLVLPLLSVIVALAYAAARPWLLRLMAAGSGM